MERLTFKQYKPVKEKGYPFQKTCAELAKLSGLPFGLMLALWCKHGNRIDQILGEIKAGEIKDIKKYLMWNLKNNI
jgi:hypothetical protein